MPGILHVRCALALAKSKVIIKEQLNIGMNIMKIITPFSKTVLALVLMFLPAFAQTTKELEQKFGPPTFTCYTIRPGVELMVLFGENGQACEMLIEPNRLLKSSQKQIPSEYIDDIINELVPLDQRGKLIINCITRSGPNGLALSDYENVCIYKTILFTKSEGSNSEILNVNRISICWKFKYCNCYKSH